MGVIDKEWKIWKLFNEPDIEKIRFEESHRNYIGEVMPIHGSGISSATSKSKITLDHVKGGKLMHGFGVFVFKKRRHRFEGEFSEDNFNGYGIYVWQNERQYYEGEWRDGRHHGLGMFVKDGGIRYEGSFVNGKFLGNGFGKYPNGDMYVGDWKDNAKHGEGMIYFEDGSQYKGSFVRGEIHGKGKIKYKNGDIYEGEFRKGIKEGLGIYRFKPGFRVYTGQFRGDEITGKGRMEFEEKKMVYEG